MSKIDSSELADLRIEYESKGLREEDIQCGPFELFQQWFDAQKDADSHEANAMFLATSGPGGEATVRTVLLKECIDESFIFYSNYQSEKGVALDNNPRAEILFYWPQFHRQLRVRGKVKKLSEEHSENYFRSRPRDAQIGALVSAQSKEVANRRSLEEQHEKLAAELGDRDVPRPGHWGGYALKPKRYEFWQGQPNRLHDRIVFELDTQGEWQRKRLYP